MGMMPLPQKDMGGDGVHSTGSRVKPMEVESAPSFSIAWGVLQIRWLQSEIEQTQNRRSREDRDMFKHGRHYGSRLFAYDLYQGNE